MNRDDTSNPSETEKVPTPRHLPSMDDIILSGPSIENRNRIQILKNEVTDISRIEAEKDQMLNQISENCH